MSKNNLAVFYLKRSPVDLLWIWNSVTDFTVENFDKEIIGDGKSGQKKERGMICFLVMDHIDALYVIWIKSKESDYVEIFLGTSYYSPMTNIWLYWKVSGEQEY